MIKLESNKKREGEDETIGGDRLKRLPNFFPSHYSPLHQHHETVNQSERHLFVYRVRIQDLVVGKLRFFSGNFESQHSVPIVPFYFYVNNMYSFLFLNVRKFYLKHGY